MKEKIPSLEELGGHQLYPQDPSVDRRPALRSILRSILVTYSKLLDSLLAPPPTSSSQLEAEWKQHLEWINILAQNIMAAANDLRPMQARGNLELMMRRQLELRREETKAIHTCVLLASVPFRMYSQLQISQKMRRAGSAARRTPDVCTGSGLPDRPRCCSSTCRRAGNLQARGVYDRVHAPSSFVDPSSHLIATGCVQNVRRRCLAMGGGSALNLNCCTST